MTRVLRSCNEDNVINDDELLTPEEALLASWDYFSNRYGWENPMKREENKISPLIPQPQEV